MKKIILIIFLVGFSLAAFSQNPYNDTGTGHRSNYVKNDFRDSTQFLKSVGFYGNIFLNGSLGNTTYRATKLWTIALESTTRPTFNGTGLMSVADSANGSGAPGLFVSGKYFNTNFVLKLNISDTAARFAYYAKLLNPAFIGIPTAPTAAPGTNTTQLATTAFTYAGLALKQNSADTLTGAGHVATDYRADVIEADLADYDLAVALADSNKTTTGGYTSGNYVRNQLALKHTLITGTKFVAPLSMNGFGRLTSDVSDAASANYVYAAKFYLPFKLIVDSIGVQITTADSGDTINVGIYDEAGTTKLIDSGPISSTATGYKKAAITPVTLQPGIYWSGYSNSVNTIRVSAVGNGGGYGIYLDISTYGYGSNQTKAGVMPASLGTISPSTSNIHLIILKH